MLSAKQQSFDILSVYFIQLYAFSKKQLMIHLMTTQQCLGWTVCVIVCSGAVLSDSKLFCLYPYVTLFMLLTMCSVAEPL